MTAQKVPWSLHSPHWTGDACGKLYTLTSGLWPQATYMDDAGLYPSKNPINIDADGFLKYFVLPTSYTLIMVDSDDKVAHGYPLEGLNGGNFNTDISAVMALVDTSRTNYNALISNYSTSDALVAQYEIDMDNRSDSDHTHVAADVLNITTGNGVLPDGVFTFYEKYSVAHGSYWICFDTPSGGFDPSPYNTLVLDEVVEGGLIPTWFEIVDGGLKCLAECTLMVDMVVFIGITYGVDYHAIEITKNGTRVLASQYGYVQPSAILCEVDDVISFKMSMSTLSDGGARIQMYIAPESMFPAVTP